MIGAARDVAKRGAHRLFLAGDRVGVHITPVHYYSATSSRRQLRATASAWQREAVPAGVVWDLDAQAGWVREVAGDYPSELSIRAILEESASIGGFRYGPIEAQLLYSFVRRRTPSRIVEIGSGSSTLVMSMAVQRNVADGRPPTEIVAIDPYTASSVASLPFVEARSIGGLDITADDLQLGAGDLLFIDSTHTVRTGSEVPHIYLNLLPSLGSEVSIHVHDIYLPYLYSPGIYREMFDWQETTLVAALLTNNDTLQVRACLSALHHGQPEALGAVFPEYRPASMANGVAIEDGGHFPSSLWLETA